MLMLQTLITKIQQQSNIQTTHKSLYSAAAFKNSKITSGLTVLKRSCKGGTRSNLCCTSLKSAQSISKCLTVHENGTVILNAMTMAMINEDCCSYRGPLGVFRTVSVEWDVSWESISYGELLIVVCDGWRVRLPRRCELEDDVRFKLPWRNLSHVVEGYVVQFDSHALKMGSNPEAKGPNGRGL